uniref:Type IV secretion system putative lipoprotein virB7 n=1 Tax=Roseihalotalea indica TaxID=2867963 RepID=A0AA49GNX3_9BACT|nr:hypothetical protein K4G66_03800 [Tunicatimonas sp. TK19036]
MKKYFILFSLITLLAGCSNEKLSRTEVVTKYYDAFNASDFSQLVPLITDSITIVEGDYVMPFSHSSFHEHFKWDSVFQPTYKIIELEEQNNQVIATVASSSKRYEFLKNNPLTCRFKISFNSDKITKLESLDCPGADWNVWQEERDSLVSWVNMNHPELDGFVHDLTMNGAINYRKAIELYVSRKDAL